MKVFFNTLFLLLAATASAQHRVTFRLVESPHSDTAQAIYIAGSFNDWQPGSPGHQLKKNSDGVLSLTIALSPGQQAFKITRGSWQSVEVAAGGKSMENRLFFLSNDTIMNLSVSDWADHYPPPLKKSTATSRVQVIDTAFFIPQLGRHRRIWICLPADYLSSKKTYPVLYMQDGQNLFDEVTSAYGEWGVDEAMDTLGPKHGPSIIVGIDHGGSQRINEYSPYDMEKYGKGEGDAYVNFLVHTLKPFIDAHFRTKKDAAHTFIAGSSMGGLISYYAVVKYPDVFGAAGVFSPAFWIAPQLKNLDPALLEKATGRIYFYAGGQESTTMESDMIFVSKRMQRYSKGRIKTVVRPEGRHSEATWRAEFPAFYAWLVEAGKHQEAKIYKERVNN